MASSNREDALGTLYESLENQFPMEDAARYRKLVVPGGAASEPVHGWFRMKEAYSHELLGVVLEDLGVDQKKPLRLHDPFAGSGTTIVSALLGAYEGEVVATGSEINPFLSLLGGSKAAVLSLQDDARQELAGRLEAAADAVVARASLAAEALGAPPALSAFGNRAYFSQGNLAHLVRIRDALGRIDEGLVRDLLSIALAACVEPSSQLRRDGRALRYTANKKSVEPLRGFRERVATMVGDLRLVQPNGSGSVFRGDSLDHENWPNDGTLDVVCFSPPYPNNIDYTEVYKLEAWMLDLYPDADAFRSQRLVTMRSHPSVKFRERSWTDVPATLLDRTLTMAAPVLEAIPRGRYRLQRERMVAGFLEDCAVVLKRSFDSLEAGGHAVYTVGNSLHGTGDDTFVIASDVLMAEIASYVGFSVDHLYIARHLHRRGRHDHLRESVVTLTKPGG